MAFFIPAPVPNATVNVRGIAVSSGLILLGQQNLSSDQPNVNFTTGFDNTQYDGYLIRFGNVWGSTVGNLMLRFSVDGGSTYLSSTYAGILTTVSSSTQTNAANSTSGMVLTPLSTAQNDSCYGDIIIHPNTSAAPNYNCKAHGTAVYGGSGVVRYLSDTCINTASQYNALRLVHDGGGNLKSGAKFSLYGFKNA